MTFRHNFATIRSHLLSRRFVVSVTSGVFYIVGAVVSVLELATIVGLVKPDYHIDFIRPAFVIILLILAGIIYAGIKNWPRSTARCVVPGAETFLEVEIADLFAGKGAYVVPVTTTFDCDLDAETVSPDSVLGTLVSRYFKDWRTLKAAIDAALVKRTDIVSEGNSDWGDPIYPLGTVLRMDHETKVLWMKKKRRFFLLCSSCRNASGQAKSEINEVLDAVARLFTFLNEQGGYTGPLRMPVIGTGYGRVGFRIDEVVRQLALQFLASCTGR
jgi:Thoeris protein ThsA, Macro domain